MNSLDLHIIIIALLVAYACILPGIFLMLRGMALMSDAISHAILPGIVSMFLITHNLHSPWLIIAASGTGLLTVIFTELLISTHCLKKDAAIGLVFPLFFSVGIILISMYARTVHLDSDMVIMGEIIFAPFNMLTIYGYTLGPQAIWVMGMILIINALFVSFCFKELQLTTFSPTLAHALGVSPWIVQYLLMCLTSITCVGAFDIVGSIVVVALIIGPASSAFMICNNLNHLIRYSFLYATTAVLLGYAFAYIADISIAGAIATANGILFIGTLAHTLYRQQKHYGNKQQWLEHAVPLLCYQLEKHSYTIEQLAALLHWPMQQCKAVVFYAQQHKLIKPIDYKQLLLTVQGQQYLRNTLPTYVGHETEHDAPYATKSMQSIINAESR